MNLKTNNIDSCFKSLDINNDGKICFEGLIKIKIH